MCDDWPLENLLGCASFHLHCDGPALSFGLIIEGKVVGVEQPSLLCLDAGMCWQYMEYMEPEVSGVG